jgi:hypothetical protein
VQIRCITKKSCLSSDPSCHFNHSYQACCFYILLSNKAFTCPGCLQDKRVDFEEWGKMKQEGWAPFGQLPVLEVDGKYLAQSAAIGRWHGYTSNGGYSIIVVTGLLSKGSRAVEHLLLSTSAAAKLLVLSVWRHVWLLCTAEVLHLLQIIDATKETVPNRMPSVSSLVLYGMHTSCTTTSQMCCTLCSCASLLCLCCRPLCCAARWSAAV